MIMLVPPPGVTGAFVGQTGHYHDGPTDCVECAPYLVAMGYRYADWGGAVHEDTATPSAPGGRGVGSLRDGRRPSGTRKARGA